MPDHDHVHDHPDLTDMIMKLQALMPVENHFSTNNAEI